MQTVEEVVDLCVPVVLQGGVDRQSFNNEVRNDPILFNLHNTADKREHGYYWESDLLKHT